MNASPEYFDSLNYSEPNTLNRVEHFENVRLSVELEGVLSIEIEFNALGWLER